jgi:hypothetical protein
MQAVIRQPQLRIVQCRCAAGCCMAVAARAIGSMCVLKVLSCADNRLHGCACLPACRPDLHQVQDQQPSSEVDATQCNIRERRLFLRQPGEVARCCCCNRALVSYVPYRHACPRGTACRHCDSLTTLFPCPRPGCASAVHVGGRPQHSSQGYHLEQRCAAGWMPGGRHG